ncbi:type IVB secretion system protein IcmH/DotU [Paraburkholderia sediminicola]|nr:type IVB secretion system protein IcmH/DotU [Paraburkholderia sediminicola]
MTSTSQLLPVHRAPASLAFRSRVKAAEEASNPLLEAARALLQALADTPAKLDGHAVELRHEWLEHEVRVFERVCAELQLRPEHVRNARYCLCAALDEAAMQTNWGKGVMTGVEWNTNGLSATFSGDRQGGDGVYRIIRQAMTNALENLDLIDVIQNILDLGFQGRYRFEAGGQNRLAAIRHQVHDAIVTDGWSLPYQRARSQTASSLPRWQIDPWVRPAENRGASRWIAIGVVSAVLVGALSYGLYERLTRDTRSEQTATLDTLTTNLNALLKNEIAAGTISLEENLQHTALTLRFNDMFLPGEPTVNAWIGPLIATAGREIARLPGRVQVTGHTDSLPADRRRMASNQMLSEQRAKQVMQILLAAGVPADRLDATGKGEADPLAGNETAQGRTRNRRVEITLSE